MFLEEEITLLSLYYMKTNTVFKMQVYKGRLGFGKSLFFTNCSSGFTRIRCNKSQGYRCLVTSFSVSPLTRRNRSTCLCCLL